MTELQLALTMIQDARGKPSEPPTVLYDDSLDVELFSKLVTLRTSVTMIPDRFGHTVLFKPNMRIITVRTPEIMCTTIGNVLSLRITVGSGVCLSLSDGTIIACIGITQAVRFYITTTLSDYMIIYQSERRLSMTQQVFSLVRNVPIGTPSEVTAKTLPMKVVITADAFFKTMNIPIASTIAFLTQHLDLSPDVCEIGVDRCYQSFHVAPSFYMDAGKMQYLIGNSEAAQELATMIRSSTNSGGHTSFFGSN